MAIRSQDLTLVMTLLNGTPSLLGTIVATTTKNNHDTAVPFNDTGAQLTGKTLLLQPDTACYVYFGATNAVTATTSHLYIDANQTFVVRMRDDIGFVACVAVSGTTNLHVFELI